MSSVTFHSSMRAPLKGRTLLSSTSWHSARRSMATSTLKKEWLAILPDKPNVLEIRKKVKGDHYEGIKPLIASGTLPAGGAFFEKHPVDGEPALFKGSIVVYSAENVEQVREIIENDVYARSGVWDVANAQIIPYVAAVREPLTK